MWGSRGAPQTAVDERMPRNVAIATEAELEEEAEEVDGQDGQRVLVLLRARWAEPQWAFKVTTRLLSHQVVLLVGVEK